MHRGHAVVGSFKLCSVDKIKNELQIDHRATVRRRGVVDENRRVVLHHGVVVPAAPDVHAGQERPRSRQVDAVGTAGVDGHRALRQSHRDVQRARLGHKVRVVVQVARHQSVLVTHRLAPNVDGARVQRIGELFIARLCERGELRRRLSDAGVVIRVGARAGLEELHGAARGSPRCVGVVLRAARAQRRRQRYERSGEGESVAKDGAPPRAAEEGDGALEQGDGVIVPPQRRQAPRHVHARLAEHGVVGPLPERAEEPQRQHRRRQRAVVLPCAPREPGDVAEAPRHTQRAELGADGETTVVVVVLRLDGNDAGVRLAGAGAVVLWPEAFQHVAQRRERAHAQDVVVVVLQQRRRRAAKVVVRRRVEEAEARGPDAQREQVLAQRRL
mmetsp:Transcript_17634/g.60969  ORF Transcript_17634/g.60969 Transcript_17634/m.60969 type:complete len:387 (+) Transcript_17634:749-1909(+)